MKTLQSISGCLFLVVPLLLVSGPAALANANESTPAKAANSKQVSKTPPATLPSIEERQRRLREGDLAFPKAPAPAPVGLDKTSLKAYNNALSKYYKYRSEGYDHRMRVFEWQLLSSKFIFVVVLLLVFLGIYFAAIQFHRDLKSKETKETGDATTADETTEFVFSFKSIKVRSPVLGVVILVVSLAFFYLYLVYVYPIVNVF